MPRKTATPRKSNAVPTAYRDTTKPLIFKPTLNERTYHALREVIDNKRMTLQQIADGSDVMKGWLRMYALGRIPDPSVSRIEKLYHFITGVRL